MTSVWHCSEEKGIKYFTSPDAEKILISHKGRIYILHLLTWWKFSSLKRGDIYSCQMAPYIIVNSQKGRIFMPTCIICYISQWGENIFKPIGLLYLHGNYIFGPKGPNEPESVAFLAYEGFSHWVFLIWRFWRTHIVMHVMLFHCNYARRLEGECWEAIRAHSQHMCRSHDIIITSYWDIIITSLALVLSPAAKHLALRNIHIPTQHDMGRQQILLDL